MELRATWKTDRLGGIATLQRGFDLPHRFRRQGPYPIVTSSGIEEHHSEAKVQGPGVVTGRYGTIGKVFFVDGPFWPLNTTLYVKDFHGNDPLFVAYLLRTINFDEHSGKTGVPGVNRNDLHEIIVTLPSSKSEQEAVASALADTDSLIESLEQLLAKKRQIKQGAMQELLTGERRLPGYSTKRLDMTDIGSIPSDWTLERLGNIGESLIGLTYKPTDVRQDGVLVLRSSNVADGTFRFEDNVFVEMNIPDRLMVRPGDILICVRNGSRDLIGKCAKVGERLIGMTFGAFMAVFRTPLHSFVYHQFQSSTVKRQINEHLGATINQITNGSLNSFQIPLPRCAEERELIADTLSDMDIEIMALEQKIARTKQLKQGMMQELLTGRIRLR